MGRVGGRLKRFGYEGRHLGGRNQSNTGDQTTVHCHWRRPIGKVTVDIVKRISVARL